MGPYLNMATASGPPMAGLYEPSSRLPQQRVTEFAATQIYHLVLPWTMVSLRAYVRHFMLRSVVADDWWMFASMVAYTGYAANNLYGATHGSVGQSISSLTPVHRQVVGLRSMYVSECLYAPVSAMVRTSIALFLHRLAIDQLHRRIIYGTILVVWLNSIVFTLVSAFQCRPINYFYDWVLGVEGSCLAESITESTYIAQSVIGAVCDFIFAGLPVAMLWNARLNRRTRLSIGVLLGLGTLSGAALLGRIPYTVRAHSSGQPDDFFLRTIDAAEWTLVEPSVGITTACMATLRPLLKRLGFEEHAAMATPRLNTYESPSESPSSSSSSSAIEKADLSPSTRKPACAFAFAVAAAYPKVAEHAAAAPPADPQHELASALRAAAAVVAAPHPDTTAPPRPALTRASSLTIDYDAACATDPLEMMPGPPVFSAAGVGARGSVGGAV